MKHESDVGILCFSPERWDTYWMSRHHLISGLSKHYKILWVSPPLTTRQAFFFKGQNGLKRGVMKVTPFFWFYAPEKIFPINTRNKIIEEFFLNRLIRRIRSVLNDMGIVRVILYIWRPNYFIYIGRFNEEITCYHVTDEYSWADWELPNSETEEYLLKNSDIVFFSSKTLLKKKGSLNPESHYLPHGVDFSFYHSVMQKDESFIKDYKLIPKPRIGYVGYIKKQLDLNLLYRIAKNKKDWSIVLVGPIRYSHQSIRNDFKLLCSEKNVYYLGAKNPKDVPRYIKELDVCLMNYLKNDYTKYIYPLKLQEYLSCGKPIVATHLDNLNEFRDVLYFADGFKDWIYKIQLAINESDHKKLRGRIEIAQQNTWDRRVEKIHSILKEKLIKISTQGK